MVRTLPESSKPSPLSLQFSDEQRPMDRALLRLEQAQEKDAEENNLSSAGRQSFS